MEKVYADRYTTVYRVLDENTEQTRGGDARKGRR